MNTPTVGLGKDTPSVERRKDSPAVERRKMSHAGMLDSAISVAHQLVSSRDPMTSSLANRLLGELMQLRRELPSRRANDRKLHSR
jgi:hypothetical protein